MAKVTGLGGVFFVSKDPDASRAWYRDALGIDGPYGPQMEFSEDKKERAYSLLSMFSDAKYFQPSSSGFMINLRVDDLDGFCEGLRAKNVDILDQVDEGYGKFAWVMDPDGIKIELWEQCDAPPPIDSKPE